LNECVHRTDVWALGCCLYSLAFLQNCFEEGSNLAILSRKYKIPDDNPYGDGLVELLDRMLTVDAKARSDMTEVILCLSAVYSGRPLPPRKKPSKPKKEEGEGDEARKSSRTDRATASAEVKEAKGTKKKKEKAPTERLGTYRTDGQGIYDDGLGPSDKKEVSEDF
jgi:serine/threonine protein kinase